MLRAILYTVTFLVFQLLTGAVVMFAANFARDKGVAIDSGLVLLVSAALSSLVTIVFFLKMRWAEVSRHYLLSRPYDVLFWAVIASLGTIVPSMLMQELIPELPPVLQKIVDETAAQMAQLMNMRGGYFLIAILVPLAEELVFRGAILRALLKWMPSLHWPMIAISALLFALVHGNPAQMPHAFLIGLMLGWLYYRTGSILPGVVWHCANNTVAYVLFVLYPDPDIALSNVLGNNPRTIMMACVCSLLVFLPAIYQLHLRMPLSNRNNRNNVADNA